MSGKILGVDFGTVRVGLAISDVDRKFAFPLEMLRRQTKEQDATFFAELVKNEAVTMIVVGLPVHLSGDEGQKAYEARQFGKWLGEVTGLPIVFYDERFTTVQAESALWEAGLTHKKRKARRDQVAAQILLQTYLEAGCPENPQTGPMG